MLGYILREQAAQNQQWYKKKSYGFVNDTGDLVICVKENVGKGIKLIPIRFNGSNGKWCLNLWYAEVSMKPDYILVQDHSKLKEFCTDYF